MTKAGDSEECYVAEPLDQASRQTTEDKMVREENNAELRQIIGTLPKQQSMLLNLYYFYEFNLKQCEYVMDLSESRISQIRSHALRRLEKKLENCHFSMGND